MFVKKGVSKHEKKNYKLFDADDNLIAERNGVLGWIDQSDFLENIAFQTAQGNLEYAKIDYCIFTI